MKHVFVVNPAAGDKKIEKNVLPKLFSFLKNTGLDYEIHRTLNKEEASAFVRQTAASGLPVRFYACGGDGTICDVLNGMVGYDNAELAIYPCGTGNDFVKNFSHVEYFRDFRRLTEGEAVPLDVIKFGNSYSMNMLNIGADCDIVSESHQYKSLGGFSYLAAAIKVLTEGRLYRLAVNSDGNWYEDTYLLCAVGNGKFCGGGFKNCVKAKLNDGLLDVTLVKPVKPPKLFRLLLEYRNGTYINDRNAEMYFRYFQCEKLVISPINRVNVSVDGEVETFTSREIEVLPKKVRVVIPRGSELIDP